MLSLFIVYVIIIPKIIIQENNKTNADLTMNFIHNYVYNSFWYSASKFYSNEFYSIIKILNTTFLSFTTPKNKGALSNSRVGNLSTDYCTLQFKES